MRLVCWGMGSDSTERAAEARSRSEGRGGARLEGDCFVLLAFDIGFQIDLEKASELARESTRKQVVRARRPAPVWFDYKPAPLRLVVEGESVEVDGRASEGSVEMLLYDFGAALLTYRFPLAERLEELPAQSGSLYEHAGLLTDGRARAARIMEVVHAAIERPELSEFVEDYVVFGVRAWSGDLPASEMARAEREVLARTIEGERGALSAEQAARSTLGTMSYAPGDAAVVGWNAAVLFDDAPEDVLAVLQHANVELLELRVLDQELDGILDHADETLSRIARRRVWPSFREDRMLRRFATVQTDAAVMFEGVNNAIKLLGNQYLAQLYRLTAERLDLPSWQGSIQRKLSATDSLYQKMSDAAGTRRMETLEWVIIILIAISILLVFVPVGGGH